MEITSNGSKWLGEPPDSVETLLGVLGSETLDPTFEHYGGFIYYIGEGKLHAFGNFLTCSHVFDITGTIGEMRSLAQGIKVAKRRPEYLEAKRANKCKG